MLAARLRLARRRRLRRILGATCLPIVLLAAFAVACDATLRAEGWHGPTTDHFDGERFHNLREAPHMGPREFLRWQTHRDRGPWRPYEDLPPGPKPAERVTGGGMRVTIIGHATTLLQFDGLNVLTDPIYSDRCSPVSFAGPKRVRPPAIRFEYLPPIDLVVVSHAHYDHLDLDTLKRLDSGRKPLFLVGLGIKGVLAKAGITNVRELDWWDAVDLGQGRTVTSVPTQHFSNRGLSDQDRTLWMGYVFSGPSGTAFFAGDTGAGPHFSRIHERFPALRLAILPIGAYRPEWFMERIHMSPAQAVDAHRQLGAATSVGMHYGTFDLADEGQDEPLQALAAAVEASPEPKPHFLAPAFGDPFDVP